MKRHLGFLVSCCVVLCGPAVAAGTNGIYQSAGSNGSVELSNLAGDQGGELLIAAPEAPAATATPVPLGTPLTAAPSYSPNTPGTGDSSRKASADKTTEFADSSAATVNEQYRNHIQQQMLASTHGGPNPAASRRYLMQSRPPMSSFGR